MKKYKRYQQALKSSSVVFTDLTPYVEKVDGRKKRRTETLLNCCSVLVDSIAKDYPDSLEELHQILVKFKESQRNK